MNHIYALFIICFLYLSADASAGENKKAKPKADPLIAFKELNEEFKISLKKKNKPEDLKRLFSLMVNRLETIKSPEKRIAGARAILILVPQAEENKVLGYFYDQLPRLVNNYMYGSQASMEAISLIREYGELEFIELSSQSGYAGERNLKFQCYYVMPLNSAVQKLCQSWEEDQKLLKSELRIFNSAAHKAYSKKMDLVLPEKTIKTLVKIYYAFDNVKLKKSIVACMSLCGEFRQTYILAQLLPQKEKSFKKALKKSIPEKYRGKNNPYFKSDIYEEK